jgi:hypothetical protein
MIVHGIAAGRRHGLPTIKFYTYRAGSTAEWDKFELQESAFDAIGADVDGFYTFGLGIQLELGPRTTPRFRFNWGVRLNINGPEWQFYSGAMGGERITFAEPKNYEDIQFLAEATYNWLLRYLTAKVELAPKIGFRFVSEVVSDGVHSEPA